MKRLQPLILTGITALLSGCACECADDPAIIYIQFQGYRAEELKTIFVVNSATPDTLFNWADVIPGNSTGLWVQANTQYKLISDSIPLNKVIEVKEIRSETTKEFACECTKFIENYEVDGRQYTNEPIIITK